MTIAIETTPTATVVAFDGQVSSANAIAIEREMLALLDTGVRHLVFDCSALQFISSAGLRMVLVVAKRLAAAGGTLVLCDLHQHVREVFDISGFLAILNVDPTRAAALARFQ